MPFLLISPAPRWANGGSEEKPLSVPRDTPFQLETCPLTAVDALGNSWVPNPLHTLVAVVGSLLSWAGQAGG